jgi:hypothetical protein
MPCEKGHQAAQNTVVPRLEQNIDGSHVTMDHGNIPACFLVGHFPSAKG